MLVPLADPVDKDTVDKDKVSPKLLHSFSYLPFLAMIFLQKMPGPAMGKSATTACASDAPRSWLDMRTLQLGRIEAPESLRHLAF